MPQGVINARSASDVYVQAQPAGSTVRVLKGAATARSSLSQSTIEVAGGNFVELRSAGAGRVQTASTEQIQQALAQTALSGAQVAAPAPVTAAVTPAERQTPPPPARSHLKRNVLILAIIGAAGAGAAAAASGGGGSSSSTTTTPPPTSWTAYHSPALTLACSAHSEGPRWTMPPRVRPRQIICIWRIHTRRVCVLLNQVFTRLRSDRFFAAGSTELLHAPHLSWPAAVILRAGSDRSSQLTQFQQQPRPPMLPPETLRRSSRLRRRLQPGFTADETCRMRRKKYQGAG